MLPIIILLQVSWSIVAFGQSLQAQRLRRRDGDEAGPVRVWQLHAGGGGRVEGAGAALQRDTRLRAAQAGQEVSM